MPMKVELGAPSLNGGKDAKSLLAPEFAGAKYPLRVTVTNHMPRDAVFPEVDGLFLRHCAAAEGSVVSVKVASADLLQRVASSIEQVATLNGYARAVTIEADAPPVAPSKAKPSAAAAAAAAAAAPTDK